MDFQQYRKQVKNVLKENGMAEDADFLLCECLKEDRTQVLLKKDINKKEVKKINLCVKKRINNQPLTKIFKKAYFCGEVFYINKHVLSPRKETEILVEEVLKIANPTSSVLDLCCGSGSIAIILSKNNLNVLASDISSKALRVAKINNKKLNTKVHFVKSDLFKKIGEKFDIIVSNPPYIPTDEILSLDKEVKKYDPTIALDGGKDGYSFYKKIIRDLPTHLMDDGYVFFEVGYNQAKNVEKMLKNISFSTKIIKDYDGNQRIVVGKKEK